MPYLQDPEYMDWFGACMGLCPERPGGTTFWILGSGGQGETQLFGYQEGVLVFVMNWEHKEWMDGCGCKLEWIQQLYCLSCKHGSMYMSRISENLAPLSMLLSHSSTPSICPASSHSQQSKLLPYPPHHSSSLCCYPWCLWLPYHGLEIQCIVNGLRNMFKHVQV